MEVHNIQQSTFDQFQKLIKDNASNKQEIANSITNILENTNLNTYSEFLQISEINEVNKKLIDSTSRL